MEQQSPAAIKEQVRTHYGKLIQLLPDDVVPPSYGCGNPFTVADLKPGEVVLDLGSGAGLDALLAARTVGEHGRVYGLDLTDEMLELAERNARKAGARNVVFLRGDIESIPLPNESVDVIISNCVVNLAPNKDAALSEAHRVLRPGGRFAISDIVVDGDLEGLPLDEHQIRTSLSWAGCMAGALTTTELHELLTKAGFTNVRIDIFDRYSRARLKKRLSPEIASLPDAVVDDLLGRFASSLISAVRQ